MLRGTPLPPAMRARAPARQAAWAEGCGSRSCVPADDSPLPGEHPSCRGPHPFDGFVEKQAQERQGTGALRDTGGEALEFWEPSPHASLPSPRRSLTGAWFADAHLPALP